MRFLASTTHLRDWHLGLVKIAMLCLGLIVGMYYSSVFKPIAPFLWGVLLVALIWIVWLWVERTMD